MADLEFVGNSAVAQCFGLAVEFLAVLCKLDDHLPVLGREFLAFFH